jgi:hypothetical protein
VALVIHLLANFRQILTLNFFLDLYKGVFMEKMTQIRQTPKKKNSKSPDFIDKFQQVAKNIEGF